MAKCKDCGNEMTIAISCYPRYIIIDNEVFNRNTEYFDVNEKCHDCGIKNEKGNVHHYGCDIERCPKCDGQLISCGCKKGELLVNVQKIIS